MPANYTGDGTATQSPSTTPAAGSPPIAVLPVDGDADNAASVAQAFKVLADFIAWLLSPFANASAWVQKIIAYRDAKLHMRFAIDHWGKTTSCLDEWVENWATPYWALPKGSATPTFGQAGTGSYFVGRWNIVLSSSGSATYSIPPATAYANPPLPASMVGSSTPNASRQFVLVLDGATPASTAEIRLGDDAVTTSFADDTLVSLDADVTPFTVLDVIWVCGFTSEGQGMSGISDGVYFARPDTAGANWQCITISGGVATGVDSGVLAGAGSFHHLRIELVGASADDASTARALFYIDGALKANITTHLPINTGKQMIPIFGGERTTGSIADPVLLLGPVRYSQINALATP